VEFQRPAIGLIALLVTLIIAFRVTRTIKAPESGKKALKAGAKGGNLNVVVGAPDNAALSPGDDEAALLPPGPSNRELVAAHIDSHPEIAVKMIRNWIKED
jgi:flagellar biosynthesis/type III secretory pathway M-ring protein FliF/YscJ